MGRYKEEPTRVARLPLKEARMIRALAKHWGIDFKTAFRKLAGKNVEAAFKKLKAGSGADLGGEG